jgi:hypothetical protein
MPAIHVVLDGDDLGNFDIMKTTNSDAYLIEGQFGLTLKGFLDGVGEMRASAIDALIWIMYHHLGRTVDKHLIRWSLDTLHMEEVVEPDPSVAVNGTADANTSDSSPTSAT